MPSETAGKSGSARHRDARTDGEKMRKELLVSASALTIVMSATVAALAQDDASDSGKVETVIVTATKKAESLQDVPISLVAVSGKMLEDRGFKQFTDLQAAVPNLEVDQTNGNFALTMRGLGAGPGNLAFEQSVGLFVDGVYSSRARSLQIPFLDIERVEVVRGPQGALFGKNTNAGAISMITRKPTDDFEAEGRAGAEFENGGYAFSGFVSGPVVDTVDARISGEVGYNGGFVKNNLTGKDESAENYYALRGQVSWKPTDDFNALLKVEGFNDGFNGATLEYNNIGDPSCTKCMQEQAASGGASAQTYPAYWRTARSLYPELNTTKSGTAELTTNWNVAGWDLTSIIAYQDVGSRQAIDPTGGGLTILFSFQNENSNQLSAEFRGEHDFGSGLDVLAGVTVLRNMLSIEQDVIYAGIYAPFTLPNADSDRLIKQDGYSISPYLVANYQPADHIYLTASVRYSDEQKHAEIQHILTGGSIGPTSIPYDLYGNIGEGLWDYSGKARYEFDEDMSVYVSYATGTKAGGFVSNNSTLGYDVLHNGATVDYKPERAKSWEIGGKFRFFDGHADLNIALFDTNFDDLQVSTYVASVATFLTGNAAKAHSRGVELDGNWRPDQYFGFGASAAYLDARYDDYPGGACLYNAPTTCTPATNNLAGSVLLRAPMWKGSVYGQAQTLISDALRLSGRLSLDFSSRAYFQPDLNPLNSQPTFTKVDARVAVGDSDDRWELSLTARNLANTITFGQAFTTPVLADNSHAVLINPGRTIMLEGVIRY
jgi:iron complex outermembrane receptor protein